MTWKPYQQLRLAQERSAVRNLVANFDFYDPTGDTHVFGWWTSNTNRQYAVRINIPPGYPDAIPNTYITHPSPLHGYRGPIESYGNSHAMHTWETDMPGWTKICIVHPEAWDASYSIVKVLRKAFLWITAYECHLDEGRNIADFLL